jgi:uncharacterized membrane protein
MQMLVALVFLLAPAAVIYLAHHQRWAQRIGVIVLCYGLGLAIGSAGLVPERATGATQFLSEVTIVFALPLLLFTLDVRQWFQVAGKALLSMLLAVTAVTSLASMLFFIYRDDSAAAADLAAMSVGVYSGGTPNLAAIKSGLEIPDAHYLAFHSLDAVVGSVYFLFMLTLGVPLFRALLPDRKAECAEPWSQSDGVVEYEDQDDYRPLIAAGNVVQVATAIALAAVVVALSFGLAAVLATAAGGERNSAVLIVALTTLGIFCSLHPRVRALVLSYRLGMYLIYVFCIAVSSMVSFEELARMDAAVAIFLLVVVFAGLALHALLCRLAGVDGDTFMVTSVAAVGSPPFVPLMARALDNPGAILPGMTTGVIGYALGSYLGISLGLYLRSLQ